MTNTGERRRGGGFLIAIARKLPEPGPGKRVPGFKCDTGERCLPVPDLLPEEA